mmetsp:Transcript_63855/g.114012  ORF Transcript_63855/g.114012 Transcript_63855/m.114012 type:complete len:134 (-) Transcript_63855:266-667(-)
MPSRFRDLVSWNGWQGGGLHNTGYQGYTYVTHRVRNTGYEEYHTGYYGDLQPDWWGAGWVNGEVYTAEPKGKTEDWNVSWAPQHVWGCRGQRSMTGFRRLYKMVPPTSPTLACPLVQFPFLVAREKQPKEEVE